MTFTSGPNHTDGIAQALRLGATSPPAQVILCTAPDEDTARQLARGLVEEKLVACVNIVPRIISIYSWEDIVHEDAEVLMVIKARPGPTAFNSVRDNIVAKHPYDTPEVVALDVARGDEKYLKWITDSTFPSTR
ncbi:hypothetical protein RI367_003859 [Sorochytrium milnesiophthora]